MATRQEMMQTAKELEIIDQKIQMSLARASWWQASAITGECKHRELYQGITNEALTDEAKIHYAMNIANTHMANAQEMIDRKQELLDLAETYAQ